MPHTPLTVAQILAWADDFKRRAGRWPRAADGKVAGGLGTTWCAINAALGAGCRGLSDGSSLPGVDAGGNEHLVGIRFDKPPPFADVSRLT